MLNNVRCDSTLPKKISQQLSTSCCNAKYPRRSLWHSTTYFICVIARRVGQKRKYVLFYCSKFSLSLSLVGRKKTGWNGSLIDANMLIIIINKLSSLSMWVFTPSPLNLLDKNPSIVFVGLWLFKGQRKKERMEKHFKLSAHRKEHERKQQEAKSAQCF